jgi:hypothetical protein
MFFFFAAPTQTITLGITEQFGKQVYSIREYLPMHAKGDDIYAFLTWAVRTYLGSLKQRFFLI